ncbi:MAG: hypothetical protein JSV03_11585 [Planctomycetota bacterium]|nr:MAG: hypothetical protein JSV03_11585 [Planctomycetota bacterium]
MMRFLSIFMVFVFAVGEADGREIDYSALLEVEVVKYIDDQATLVFNMGQNTGVSVGDHFWLSDDTNTVAFGSILFVTESDSVGRLYDAQVNVAAGDKAILLREQTVSVLRDGIPEGVTIQGLVLRDLPWRRMAWLDIGRKAGLKPDDTVLVRRKGIPIARGLVKILKKDSSLISLSPLVGNALPQIGDSAELWPSPADSRWGRINSAVLEVKPGTECALITIVGTKEDGLSQGRLVDLFRADRYVGVATLEAISNPLSFARIIEASSAMLPAEGDLALVRSTPELKSRPLSAAIFRIEGNYCLLAAGEVDGVQVGDVFKVRKKDPAGAGLWQDVAELTVKTVKVDYAGADIRLLNEKDYKVELWDMAERPVPMLGRIRPIGIIEHVQREHRWAVGSVGAKIKLNTPTVIRWISDDNRYYGAAIVIHRIGGQVTIYVPPGWGNAVGLLYARLETGDYTSSILPTPVTTRPATTTLPR